MRTSEIIELLATRVMGWKRLTMPEAYPPHYKGSIELAYGWYDADNKQAANAEECGDYYCSDQHCQWNPLEDANACKQVREKLAERFRYELTMWGPKRFQFDLYTAHTHMVPLVSAEAATEELAVALAALQTVSDPKVEAITEEGRHENFV